MNITHPVQLRASKQKTLKAFDSGGFQPVPLFYFFNAFCHQRNFQIGTTTDDGFHNRLLRAAQVNIADNFSVDFDFIRLKFGQ
ncbi:hypothetical protein D3C87_2101750 [compost metagenome]